MYRVHEYGVNTLNSTSQLTLSKYRYLYMNIEIQEIVSLATETNCKQHSQSFMLYYQIQEIQKEKK